MHNAYVIAKRELGTYFKSPIAYIVLSVFLALSGFLYMNGLFVVGNASMEDFFAQMPMLLLFFAPAIAMRLFAEERGSGTLELLLTMPVRDGEVVLGKYLAGVGLLAAGLLFTIPYAITVAKLGPMDKGPVVGGYIGALLLGGTYLAVGLLASAMTKNQIVAFIVGLAICFVLFVLRFFVPTAGATLGPILEYMSPQFHFDGIARGVIGIRNVVYYLSIIITLLIFTVQALESRKWR